MKIAFDIDGVILDSERGLRFYSDYYSYFELGKSRIKRDEVSNPLCFDWTKEEEKNFYAKYFKENSINSRLVVGAKEILQKLKEEGHKLYLITLRGYYGEIKPEQQIEELGIEFDGIFWGIDNKLKKCEELGIEVMVDDNPKNVEQFKGSDTTVLHYIDGQTRECSLPNAKMVYGWVDIYKEIEKMSAK